MEMKVSIQENIQFKNIEIKDFKCVKKYVRSRELRYASKYISIY